MPMPNFDPNTAADGGMAPLLPEAFAELERFCPKWLHSTEAQRNRVRIDSNMGDIREFYDAVLSRFEEIIQYLNSRPLNAPDPTQTHLLNLVLSFVEVSAAVERFDSPIVTELFPPDRFKIHEASAATGA